MHWRYVTPLCEVGYVFNCVCVCVCVCVCDSKDYFTEENIVHLRENCVWRTHDYLTFTYYVRIVATNAFGSTISEFQFDAVKLGRQ